MSGTPRVRFATTDQEATGGNLEDEAGPRLSDLGDLCAALKTMDANIGALGGSSVAPGDLSEPSGSGGTFPPSSLGEAPASSVSLPTLGADSVGPAIRSNSWGVSGQELAAAAVARANSAAGAERTQLTTSGQGFAAAALARARSALEGTEEQTGETVNSSNLGSAAPSPTTPRGDVSPRAGLSPRSGYSPRSGLGHSPRGLCRPPGFVPPAAAVPPARGVQSPSEWGFPPPPAVSSRSLPSPRGAPSPSGTPRGGVSPRGICGMPGRSPGNDSAMGAEDLPPVRAPRRPSQPQTDGGLLENLLKGLEKREMSVGDCLSVLEKDLHQGVAPSPASKAADAPAPSPLPHGQLGEGSLPQQSPRDLGPLEAQHIGTVPSPLERPSSPFPLAPRMGMPPSTTIESPAWEMSSRAPDASPIDCRTCEASPQRPASCSQCAFLGRQVGALVQSLAGLGARVFNWAKVLSTKQHRDVAELVLEYTRPCAHLDEAIRSLCVELEGVSWDSLADADRSPRGAAGAVRSPVRSPAFSPAKKTANSLRAGEPAGSPGKASQKGQSPAVRAKRNAAHGQKATLFKRATPTKAPLPAAPVLGTSPQSGPPAAKFLFADPALESLLGLASREEDQDEEEEEEEEDELDEEEEEEHEPLEIDRHADASMHNQNRMRSSSTSNPDMTATFNPQGLQAIRRKPAASDDPAMLATFNPHSAHKALAPGGALHGLRPLLAAAPPEPLPPEVAQVPFALQAPEPPLDIDEQLPPELVQSPQHNWTHPVAAGVASSPAQLISPMRAPTAAATAPALPSAVPPPMRPGNGGMDPEAWAAFKQSLSQQLRATQGGASAQPSQSAERPLAAAPGEAPELSSPPAATAPPQARARTPPSARVVVPELPLRRLGRSEEDEEKSAGAACTGEAPEDGSSEGETSSSAEPSTSNIRAGPGGGGGMNFAGTTRMGKGSGNGPGRGGSGSPDHARGPGAGSGLGSAAELFAAGNARGGARASAVRRGHQRVQGSSSEPQGSGGGLLDALRANVRQQLEEDPDLHF